MRTQRNYIFEDGTTTFHSSFLSCEKDTELIVKKLLVESRPYSDELKRLLLINNKDCLDDRMNPEYIKKIKETSIGDLVEQGYLQFKPKITLHENEQIKSYIGIYFDDFSPTKNLHYKDCIIMVDVISHYDAWELNNYRLRPIKMAGYVDGILNNCKLTGIGRLEFMSASEIPISDNFAGYCLIYRAVHGDDDIILPEEE